MANFSPAGQDDSQWRERVRLERFDLPGGSSVDVAAAQVKSAVLGKGATIRDYASEGAGGSKDHFLVGVIDGDGFLELSARRIMQLDGNVLQIVYHRREYGSGVGPTLSRWMQENGETLETQLLSIPASVAAEFLQSLH